MLVVQTRISNLLTLVKKPQQHKAPSITAKSSIELSRILLVVVQARTLKQVPVNRLLTRLLVKAKRKTKKRNTRFTMTVSTKWRTGKIVHVPLKNKACLEMNGLTLMKKTMVREPSSHSEGPIRVHITVALRRSVRGTPHQLKSLLMTKTSKESPTTVMKTKQGLRINDIITQVVRRHRLLQMTTTLDSNREMNKMIRRAKSIRCTRLRTNLN